MKTPLLLLFLSFLGITTKAQIGVGTTTPNSTLDVRGSLSTKYTSFSANTTAASTDNMLVFTGTSAATLTVPDATTCQGRIYWIKNTSSNSSTLTIATTASQTIDGLGSWTLTQTNKAIRLVSNGTNWLVVSESLPGNSSGTAWIHGGNNVTSLQNIGTTSNYALPFITNNTEKMRLTATGNLGIGSSTFNATNAEKLLVDAGTTTSVNAIVGKGTINSYLQLNIQNLSNGTGASSDVVATADNGSETTNYVDMGINSSTNTSGVMGAANDAYLYNIGQNFLIGTGTAAKSLVFMTGGTTQSTNERMRIDGNGKLGLGINAIPKAAIGAAKFSIDGTVTSTTAGPHVQYTTSADNYPLYQHLNWAHDADYMVFDAYYDGSWKSATTAGGNFILGKEAGKFLWYYAAVNTQGSTITWSPGIALNNAGKVGIGTSTFDATYPEKLLVDAGVTTSVNAIVGKGSINNYLQLNIKNSSTGAAASSDVVATADNGSETTNYIDMGINGSGNTSGVFGVANDAYLYNVGQNMLIGTSTAGKSIVFLTGGNSQATNERMRIDGNGNVGIGCNAPNYKLQVVGDIAAQGGTIRAASAVVSTTITACSDIRFKKNIFPLNNALDNVMKLQGVTYNWKVNEFPDRFFNDKNQIGIIAQELEKVYPELVETDKAGYKTVDYSKMAPILIESIKEQQHQIKAQQEQIDLLKNEIEKIKKEISISKK